MLDSWDGYTLPTPVKSVLVVLSGGLDSSVVLAVAHKQLNERGIHHGLHAITFDYGQKNRKELWAANTLCDQYQVEQTFIDMTATSVCFNKSALVNPETAIPRNTEDENYRKAMDIPNRNMILMSLAASYAVSNNIDVVATGTVLIENNPADDSPEFREQFHKTLRMSLLRHQDLDLWYPFAKSTKTTLVQCGNKLGLDFSLTWSCIENGEKPCGHCSTCKDRLEAFTLAGVSDPLL